MRILVEALGISKFGGGRSATIPLFEALLPMASDDRFILLLDQFEPTLDFPNVQQIIVPIINRFKARLWLQWNLPKLVKREQIYLVHFAKNLTVLGIKAKVIVTIYDLVLLRYSAGFSVADIWYWKYLQPLLLRKVDKVHSISQNTAGDLKYFYQLSSDKIEVVPPPYRLDFRPIHDDEIEPIRQRYQLPYQNIMHIGSFGPKKNLDTLLKAFALFSDNFAGKLVLVGGSYRHGYDVPIRELVKQLGLTDKVIFTGIVQKRIYQL